MKRPLFILLIGLVLGELSGYLLYISGVVIPASLIFFILFQYKIKKIGKPFVILSLLFTLFMILGNLSYCYETAKIHSVQRFTEDVQGVTCTIKGTVIKRRDSSEDYTTLTLKNIDIDAGKYKNRIHGKCTVSGNFSLTNDGRNLNILPGDVLELTAYISFLQKETNPGGFNELRYDLANGIYLKGYLTDLIDVHRPGNSFIRTAYNIKNRVEKCYQEHLTEEDGALLCAMVFGDKSGLSDNMKKLYEENGVMHLLAVSGLHVSAVGGRVYRSLRKKNKGYFISCFTGGLLILFYGCMTGYGSSVIRALTMFLIFLSAEYMGLSYDMISAMSLSGMIMLLEQPYRLHDGGFLISYSSVIAIGLVIPLVKHVLSSAEIYHINDEKHEKNVREKVIDSLLSSLIIFMVTSPIIMKYYYEFTPYSVLLNPVILPCMEPLMIFALLSGAVGIFFTMNNTIIWSITHNGIYLWGWRVLCFPAILILRGQRIIFTAFRTLPGSLFITGSLTIPCILGIYAGEAILLFLIYKKWWKRSISFIGIFIFCVIFLPIMSSYHDGLKITMLDVGQGDCILLRMPGKKTMLIDGGSTSESNIFENVIRPALYYYGISSLDYVSITHMDEDHISGIREMLEAEYPVRYLMTGTTYYPVNSKKGEQKDESQEEILQLADRNHTKFYEIERGDSFSVSGISFSCLHPQRNEVYEDRNDKSLVYYITYGSFQSLFPGDLSSQQEKYIIDQIKHPVTLLKVGHHGSKYSSCQELLSQIQPEYAIISAGANNRYGHPHQETLERLYESGAKIYMTKNNSAICVDTNGKDKKIYYWGN